jgi:uncharacterized protein (DUF1697 family)
MTVYVALLRAIGPATHGRLSMADLKRGCEQAGFTDVSTYVATGNVVFAADGTAADVRRAVQAVVERHGLGGLCDAFVRTARQLRTLVRNNPFCDAAADRPQRLGVCFFQKTPAWPAWVARHDGPERIAAFTNHLIVDYGEGDAASRLQIERDTGARMTQRNWNTVAGILKKAEALEAKG